MDAERGWFKIIHFFALSPIHQSVLIVIALIFSYVHCVCDILLKFRYVVYSIHQGHALIVSFMCYEFEL